MFTSSVLRLLIGFGLAFSLVFTVHAQDSSITPGAITVFGEGSASVPAETAEVVITIGPDSGYYEEPTLIEPAVTSVPGSVDVSAIVDAIVEHGIPVEDISVVDPVFMGEWGAGMMEQPTTILVTVMNPTVEGLQDLLDLARTSAHSHSLYVNHFGVVYGVDDCRALRQQARVNAVDHARSEAEDQAAALNVTLGDVSASRDTFSMNPVYTPFNHCTVMPAMQPLPLTYMAAQFDPGLPAEVVVNVAVEVSFDLP